MKGRGSKWALAAIVLVATVAGTGVVPSRARAEPGAEDDQKARELFRLGQGHYIAGRYEKAAVFFDEAYRLSNRPELLLALANTYERMNDYGKAIDHLRQYLSSPKAKNVDAVRDRLQRLETSLRQRDEERDRLRRLQLAERERARRRGQEQAQGQAPNALELEGRTGGQMTPRPRASRLPAYLLLAGGAVGIGSAVGAGLAARQAHQDADNQCADDLVCPSSAQSALDRERRWAILADVSAVVGVGSAAVGTFLWWTRRGESRETDSGLRLQGTLLRGGGGIGIAGHF